jgi:hypothetical protein
MVGNQVGPAGGSAAASQPGTEGHHSLREKIKDAMHGECNNMLLMKPPSCDSCSTKEKMS